MTPIIDGCEDSDRYILSEATVLVESTDRAEVFSSDESPESEESVHRGFEKIGTFLDSDAGKSWLASYKRELLHEDA